MSASLRKLIATILLLVFIITYALVVMVLANTMLPPNSKWTELVFYAVAGLLWVLPAGVIVKWMHKPDPKAQAE